MHRTHSARPSLALSRRQLLTGGVGLAAFGLPLLGKAPQAAAAVPSSQIPRRAKSVIYILLEGGMSHLDTWDLKPDAPAEIRGSFQPIATTNPDLHVGEHLPLLAQQAHLYNIVRSAYSSARNHAPGLHWVLTGFDDPTLAATRSTINQKPSIGSVVARQLGRHTPDGLPPYVAIPTRTQLGARMNFGGASHLGATYDPFESGHLPGRLDKRYPAPAGIRLPPGFDLQRLGQRRDLLTQLDGLRQQVDGAVEKFDEYQQSVFDLLLGQRGREAFDINAEPLEVRERYGASVNGQQTLLARRLVEAGVGFVLVNYSRNNTWDTHRNNFTTLKDELLPPADQAVSALLVDLEQRGLLDETLVVMMGEMGRTPMINSRAGRDHWPDVYSVLMAGGGLTRGGLLGASTRDGAKPADRPAHVHEILATIYWQLGIDPHLMLPDAFGRPHSILPDAEPLRELIA